MEETVPEEINACISMLENYIRRFKDEIDLV